MNTEVMTYPKTHTPERSLETPIFITSRSSTREVPAFAAKFSEAQSRVRKDPYRVGLLPPELTAQFASSKLPVPCEFWIACDASGNPIGRISANLTAAYPGLGYFGLFEAGDAATASALIQTATQWLKTFGAKAALGPICFNTWFPYRFRVGEQNNGVLFPFEPVNPPEYPLWFERAGFEATDPYHTDVLSGVDGLIEGTRSAHKRAQSLGYTFRDFRPETLLDHEVPILHRISMRAFAENSLFESIPLEMFRQLYVPLAKKADLSLSTFAIGPAGHEAGFFFGFEDQGHFVMKSVAILPEARGAGLSNAMLHRIATRAKAKGLTRSVAALMRTGIQSESYSRKESTLFTHHYALFRKDLV